jgi:glycosyltransferase involved in cell wall biosynthesis
LPEVGGDAVLYCNPLIVQEIADAMQKLSINDQLRQELIRKGLERVRLFSWDKTANAFWGSIEQCLKELGKL